jgi:PKD repeat protein
MDDLRLYLSIFLSVSNFCLFSQILDFNISSNLCLNEQADLVNNSSGLDNIFWNFCNDDFGQAPQNENIGTVGTIGLNRGLDFINDGENFFTFLTDFSDGELYRVDFGNSPSNSNPLISKISYTGASLVSPEEIEIYKVGTEWYGFIGSASTSTGITRLDFGSSLTNTPNAVRLGNFGYSVQMRDLHLVEDNDSFILLVLDLGNERFLRINFGSSVLLSPTVTTSSPISGLSNTSGFDIVKINNDTYGYVTSLDGNSLAKINFGTSVLNNPSLLNSYNPSQLTRPFRIEIINNFNKYFAIITDLSLNTSLFDLGDLVNSNPSHISYDLSNGNTYSGEYFLGSYYFFCLTGSNFQRLTFHSDCGASIEHSNEFYPVFHFRSEGTKNIGIGSSLTNYNLSVVKNLIVNSSTAPTASFITDNSCASASSTFTPSTTGLAYSWDFDGDGVADSNLENPSYAFGTPGTYTVRLDVDDGTCHNFTTQAITLYAEPPIPAFNVSGDLCVTNALTFGNTTNDAAYAGPLTYAWDFNGEGSSALKNPTFAFTTPGTKTITLTSSIPGCENITQQVIEVAQGPVASFTANPICQGGLMSFTNQSTGADTYLWNFGDGYTSTQANPGHVYTAGGNFIVTLAATETDGCTTTFQQEVAVAYLPIADFDFDIPCSGSQGVAFYDLSSVTGADIIGRSWYVNNVLVANDQNPLISFDVAGTYSVQLEVLSSNGCSRSVTKSLDVLGTPIPSFTSAVNCQNQSSAFTDTTPGTVLSRLWNVNGQVYTSATVNHVFTSSGTFNVSLTVTSSDFCTSTTSSQVIVPPAPVMSFTASSLCAGDNILLTDVSTSADPIVSRTWSLDGTPFFNGAQALLSGATPGPHTLSLSVQTSPGCTFTTSQNVTLLPSPSAAFTASTTYGVPPFNVSVNNTSTGATSYVWRINGTQVSTAANPMLTITQTGNQVVELTATNAQGCSSKTSTTVFSVTPAVDLKVQNVTTTSSGMGETVRLTIGNEGNLPIEIFDVIVRTGKNTEVTERFNALIGIGEEITVDLSSAIQLSASKRVCVSVAAAYADVLPDDNEACINLGTGIILENPVPNPITDEATFRLILPSEQSVRLSVVHVSGRTMVDEQLTALSSGLHILRYDASQWKKGLYLVTVRSGNEVVTRKVVK